MAKVETTMGANYIDALSSIQGQLDQLVAETEDNEKAQARIKSIKNQLKGITPGGTETA